MTKTKLRISIKINYDRYVENMFGGCVILPKYQDNKATVMVSAKKMPQVVSYCVKWAWILDCQFWKVRDLVEHNPPPPSSNVG